MVATRRSSTRLAPPVFNPPPSSSIKKVTGSKRSHVSDSESEDESISVASSGKPASKRFRASRGIGSSRIEVEKFQPRTEGQLPLESGSTSDEDTKTSNSYNNSIDGAADTPATTISSRSSTTVATSTRNKGKEKAVATVTASNRRTGTRLSSIEQEIIDSQDEGGEEMGDGSDLSGPEYHGGDDDDEEEDEISIPTLSSKAKGKGKAKVGTIKSSAAGKSSSRQPKAMGKGKGKAVPRAPSPTISIISDDDLTDPLEAVDDDSDSEFTDQSDLSDADPEDDLFAGEGGFLPEDTEDETTVPTAAPVRAPPARRARTSRARGRAFPRRTREENTRYQLYQQHPELKTIWDELDQRPKITVEKDKQPDGLSLTMLPFQLEGLHWLRCQEETGFHGGILADEMGMGKTIQTIGLLMSQPRAKPNLVVAPTVALVQWKNEIEKHTDNALSVIMYHGANREDDVDKLADADVIMTTYSVLESVYRKQTTGFKRKDGIYKEDSPLHKIKFHRVILDEAHNIKDRSSKSARAAFALQTKYKLCLSGTPLQNRIGELFSLLRFLEADPFSYYYCRNCPCKSLNWKFTTNRGCDDCGHSPMHHLCFFNHELLKPIQNNGNEGPGKEAFAKLQILLKHIMLRRTKEERADDLGLPPKIVKVRRDFFNEEELDLYDSIYGDSKRQFNTYVAHGVVLNNYANIFTLITRMRQLADHPDLVLKKQAENGQNTLVCVLCDDEAEDAIKSRCHHTFCRLCVQEYIGGFNGENNPDCPKCHITLNIDLTQPAIEADYTVIKKNSIINRIDMSAWRSSTKIEALVEELYKLRSKNHTIKSIVFSQFTSMLQLVEWRLRKAGFQTAMLEGSMTPTQRNATINHFMENVETTVFLVSLKAGGVALNLIEASQVFIMDPWWNPSVEWQAADRIHRIGQARACKVTRLVIEDSIESRILDLQEKKARMIHATVGADQAAMDKLTPADMQFLFQN